MYNSDIPSRAELPSTAQLIKSTIIAFVVAIVLLFTVVLPAEHAIDPTGIGRMLKLTEMGEIKKQLAAEAEADRIKDQQSQPEKKSSLGTTIASWIIGSAQAQELKIAQAAARSEELTISLKPGEGAEYKMTMKKGAKVNYGWEVTGGKVNYDMHGTPWSKIETSYKKDRGVAGDTGVLEAKFDGTHGWFWRNRDKETVTIKLKVNGDYTDLKKM
ncbi:transmembrane anchor protein [Rhabdaerophilum sp. SD176]|uniref:transmembrane anchor protein n=1 Tax=Rhabdaerophilum sp. SD176 TaxID=2983548 RepID=UPI0024DF66E2|nr:transmembrane anchor protein [Rhabdaerophilum sp. SD176]